MHKVISSSSVDPLRERDRERERRKSECASGDLAYLSHTGRTERSPQGPTIITLSNSACLSSSKNKYSQTEDTFKYRNALSW